MSPTRGSSEGSNPPSVRDESSPHMESDRVPKRKSVDSGRLLPKTQRDLSSESSQLGVSPAKKRRGDSMENALDVRDKRYDDKGGKAFSSSALRALQEEVTGSGSHVESTTSGSTGLSSLLSDRTPLPPRGRNVKIILRSANVNNPDKGNDNENENENDHDHDHEAKSLSRAPRSGTPDSDHSEESGKSEASSSPLSDWEPPPPPGSKTRITLRTANVNNLKKKKENEDGNDIPSPPRTPGPDATNSGHSEVSIKSEASSSPLSLLSGTSPPYPGRKTRIILRTANVYSPNKKENEDGNDTPSPPRTLGHDVTDTGNAEASIKSEASSSPVLPLSDWTLPPYPGSKTRIILRTENVNNPNKDKGDKHGGHSTPKTPQVATAVSDSFEESDTSGSSSPLSPWDPPPCPGYGTKLILRTRNVNPRSKSDNTKAVSSFGAPADVPAETERSMDNVLSPPKTRSGRRYGKPEFWGGRESGH